MEIKEIKQLVFDHKPALKSLIEKNGHLPVLDYFKKELPENEVVGERKNELIDAIKEKTENLLDQKTAASASSELKKKYFCSTADHHQPLAHPFFSNANLVQSFVNKEKGQKNILVLACSNISINNSSYPRGIFFHDRKINEIRLPFFSLKHRHRPIFGLEPYSKENLKKIPDVLVEVYLNEKVLNAETYSNQITQTNFELWKKVPGQSETNLIYLNQEEIVSGLILKHHLNEPTIIKHLLLNPDFHKSFANNFENIIGAFSTKNRKGTFLFWGFKDGLRVPLVFDRKKLVARENGYSLPLENESIKLALEKKEIFPSMALSFITLCFYYGLPCGGGFSQINYLGETKNAYLNLLKETGASEEETKFAQKIPTDIFRGEFVLTRIADKEKTAPATLIDLILYSEIETAQKVKKLSETIPLETALEQMMPEFYKIITGQKIKAEMSDSIKPIINF